MLARRDGGRVSIAALAMMSAACQAWGGRPGGDGPVVVPDPQSTRVCIGTCQPDPGSRAFDCAEAKGIDPLPLMTFDEADKLGNFKAGDVYSYSDNTAPRVFLTDSSQVSDGGGYEPPTEIVQLCNPDPAANAVLHIAGGPFKGWGGGIGIALQKLNNSDGTGDNNKNYCGPQVDGRPPPPFCPPPDAEYAVRVAALDVSAYEGVSFWARRGPNSQLGLRVNVGDKYTDDDLSYLADRQTARTGQPETRYCERNRECACRNHQPCTKTDSPPEGIAAGFLCGHPTLEQGAVQFDLGNLQGSDVYCSTTACDRPYAPYPNDDLPPSFAGADGGKIQGDPRFYGRPCTPYAFADGNGTSYCFDPAKDPPPVPGVETCGDHWMTTVDLTTDWKFYRVPFTDLRQQGYGKKSPKLDLRAVSLVRLTWDVGYIDYWIDDVSFYRALK